MAKKQLDEQYAKFVGKTYFNVKQDGIVVKKAIGTVYPTTEIQHCIVHMIINTLQYVSYKDRKELAKDLKQINEARTNK